MISRKYKALFIHIPKAAGSSIEKAFNIIPFDWKELDTNHLVGWDPVNKIHLQHASVKELISCGYISEDYFRELYSFAIVRNPFDRAVSDYFYLSKRWHIEDSFRNYILEDGEFKKIFDKKNGMYWRGDHTYPQVDFLTYNNRIFVNEVFRFEEINSSVPSMLTNRFGLSISALPHEKKSLRRKRYSEYINKENRYLLEKKYAADIEMFEYKFEQPKRFYFLFDFFKIK